MPEDSSTPDWFEVPIRVRYCETDAMGLLHHANYLNYFEQARTELFRAEGGSYRYMEERGFYFVIVKVEVDYKRPGRFDDDLRVLIRVSKRTAAKIEHEYEVYFGQLLMNKARTIVACVDRQGQVQRITDDIMYGDRESN
ncbi:MAG: acyl-CoA thioesterase [Planctomycetaceae bacterium]|nr:acyl-CoA thioesterase [Planctomycetaceae bacterium]